MCPVQQCLINLIPNQPDRESLRSIANIDFPQESWARGKEKDRLKIIFTKKSLNWSSAWGKILWRKVLFFLFDTYFVGGDFYHTHVGSVCIFKTN